MNDKIINIIWIKKMSKRVVTLLSLLFLTSCFSMTPPVELKEAQRSVQQLDLNGALIINDELRNKIHTAVMEGRCRYFVNNQKRFGEGFMRTRSLVGEAVEKLFIKGVPFLVKELDVLSSIDQIKKKDYDIILIPDISVSVSYDKSKAAQIKGEKLYLISSDYDDWRSRNCFNLWADIDLRLDVIDAQNNLQIGSFWQSFRGVTHSCNPLCSRGEGDYNETTLGERVSEAIGLAMNKAFPLLLNKVEVGLRPFVQAKKEKETLPAILALEVQYTDKLSLLPNNTIDAAEESTVEVIILNQGKGTAFDVSLSLQSNVEGVQHSNNVQVGDIQPGESKKEQVGVKAGLNLANGTVRFDLQALEKRGYDSKKYVLEVPAAKLEKPDIVISDFKINDSNTGLASGNGNGIPENGETIELIPLVKNNGVGKSIQVDLGITSINNGLEIQRKNVVIPDIMPGQTVTGNLAFSIPRTYSGGPVNITLEASDIRGALDAKKLVAINTETNRPILAYTYKILDGNENGSLENGERGEIEILPANKGRAEARDVRLDIRCDAFSFSKTQIQIDRISAESKWVPIRFPFTVPRTFQKEAVDLEVKMDQRDFTGLTDHIRIPINLVIPDLQISHQILDPNNNGIVEQGETIGLIVRVKNVGALEANDVSVTLDVDKQGLVMDGGKTLAMGRIPAGGISDAKTVTIHVQRRASVGELPVHFEIAQKDFSNNQGNIALNVAEERVEVIAVEGQKRPELVVSRMPASAGLPPIVVIATPKDNLRTASEKIILAGTAVDDRGVANIEIAVNGRRIDATRAIAVFQKAGATPRERDFRIEIPLQKGGNDIVVTAYDIENLSNSKSITVTKESERGEVWVAAIGINRYQNPDISLKYARNDAKAFADYMRTHMGVDHDHLFELYDDEATFRNIKSLLGTTLRKKADSPEDTVYIFFAGHGAPEEDPNSKDVDGITKYILPYDMDVQDLYGTAMPMDRIAEIFGRIGAERVIFIADSCYSGGSGGRTILASRRRAKLSDAFLERIARAGKGRIILTSSSANEVSLESDDLRHGYFTHYLLEGLKGGADIGNDGLVDIDEIYRYLNNWVPRATNGAQHPVKKGEAEGLVIVGKTQ